MDRRIQQIVQQFNALTPSLTAPCAHSHTLTLSFIYIYIYKYINILIKNLGTNHELVLL